MDSCYHGMEEKSILSYARTTVQPEPEFGRLIFKGTKAFDCDWLPEDLRLKISESFGNDCAKNNGLSTIDWLKQIRFNCVGDFCDVVELNKDADSFVSEEINDLRLIDAVCMGDSHSITLEKHGDYDLGGCEEKHSSLQPPANGDLNDTTVPSRESVSRCARSPKSSGSAGSGELVCEASEGNSEQDSDSFTGYFDSSVYSKEVAYADTEDSRDDQCILFTTLPVRQLNFERSLSAISELSDEVFLPENSSKVSIHTEDRLNIMDTVKRSDINLIFDDGVTRPVPPARKKNNQRRRECCSATENEPLVSRYSAPVQGVRSEDVSSISNRCGLTKLYTSPCSQAACRSLQDSEKDSLDSTNIFQNSNPEHVQSAPGIFRSLVDIPKAIEIESQNSNFQNIITSVKLRPHNTAVKSPRTESSAHGELSYYDNLGFDDSLIEKNPEDLLLINRVSQSTKLKRHPKNSLVHERIYSLHKRSAVDDSKVVYKTLPIANSERSYRRNTISEGVVSKSELSLNSTEKSKMDADEIGVGPEFRSSERLNRNRIDDTDTWDKDGLTIEVTITNLDGKRENLDELSYETIADENLEVSADKYNNDPLNDETGVTFIDNDGLAKPNPLDSGLSDGNIETFIDNQPSNISSSETSDLIESDKFAENAENTAYKNLETFEKGYVQIDSEGLSKTNPLENNPRTDDTENISEESMIILNSNDSEKITIDMEGLAKNNELDMYDSAKEVELLNTTISSTEVNVSDVHNSEGNLDNSEGTSRWEEPSGIENFKQSRSEDISEALSTCDNFSSLEHFSDPDYDDTVPTYATILEGEESTDSKDYSNDSKRKTSREESNASNLTYLGNVSPDTNLDTTHITYFNKFNYSKTSSEYSDANKDDRFGSLDSEKSFHSALDKVSPTRSEYENSCENLTVVEESSKKENVSSLRCDAPEGCSENPESPKIINVPHAFQNNVPEKLYVNFPLKGNFENPDLVTSTPNKPVRKHLNVNTNTPFPEKCRKSKLNDNDPQPAKLISLTYHEMNSAPVASSEVQRKFRERKGSAGSDIVDWKKDLWKSLWDDEDNTSLQWFSSNDAQGKIYFFEENSNQSSWVLPSTWVSESTTPTANVRYDDVEIRNSTGSDKVRVQSKARSMVLVNQSAISRELATRKSGSIPRDWPQLFDGNMCVLKEGALNRTKITENGKKLRKNWSMSHVVLTELFLLFFKDAKTFAAMKTGQSASAKPDISVDLNGALVESGERASSRKNVSIISTVLGLQVLIQTDNPVLATEWFQEIHAAISHLPSGFDAYSKSPLDVGPREISSKIFLDTNSLEENKKFPKIGRSRSVKIRRPEGSLEDLSGTAAERQTKIKAKLRRFFQRRPTMDSLVKNGIYKDEPAFGSYLSDVCCTEPPRVPRFVKACIEVLENNPENMKADGLYRASGNLSQIQKIRLQVDQNNLEILAQEEDVHVLTGALKLFFRELKEPLIPFPFFEKALNASMSKKRAERIQSFREIVKALPPPNHDTLQFLLQHLLRVTLYQEYNRMHIPNLAIVFGPTLMWPAEESLNMALDLMQQNLVIDCLLSEYDKIFK